MNALMRGLLSPALLFLLPIGAMAQAAPAPSYVGVAKCVMCHKTPKSGNQADAWKQSKHADAYQALLTPRADSIAKAKGLTTAAKDAPACLGCHTTPGAPAADRALGIQCETCHGAGSAYKGMSVMKDKAQAVAAGMTAYTNEVAIEKQCRTCHNEKSPSFKPFAFKERWAKIKHPRPSA